MTKELAQVDDISVMKSQVKIMYCITGSKENKEILALSPIPINE